MEHQDRRRLARLSLEVFVRIRTSGAELELGETRNLSASGLYLHTHAPLAPGQELECVLVLPEQITHAPAPMFVQCRGKVLRVNQRPFGQSLGAAVEIFSYRFSWPEGSAEPL